jgi:zinc protease
MSQEDPDYPAKVLANYMVGGSITARIPDRIRNREGLSYSVSTSFSAPAEGNSAIFSMNAISNPANAPKVEASFMDELRKALREGFRADEVAAAKQAYPRCAHGGAFPGFGAAGFDGYARRPRAHVEMGMNRWMRRFQALTPEQISTAFRKHVDPTAISIAKSGDFKAAKVYQ